jgi:hypothetical protein
LPLLMSVKQRVTVNWKKEIFEELSKRPARIPWMKRVLKVEVTTD